MSMGKSTLSIIPVNRFLASGAIPDRDSLSLSPDENRIGAERTRYVVTVPTVEPSQSLSTLRNLDMVAEIWFGR